MVHLVPCVVLHERLAHDRTRAVERDIVGGEAVLRLVKLHDPAEGMGERLQLLQVYGPRECGLYAVSQCAGLNGVLQQRGLSGIFTRFPFHPVDDSISRNQFSAKVMNLLKTLCYFLGISDAFK